MVFATIYAFYLAAATRQIVGRGGLFVKAWELDELCFALAQYDSDCEVLRTRVLLEKEGRATRFISSPSDQRVFLAIHKKWFVTYITVRLSREQDCYFAKVQKTIRA